MVRITVNKGSNKPYYLKGKGLKPSGVYVRQGTSSVPASPEQIRQMIKESDGDTFEEMCSMEQDLSFEAASNAFRKYGVPFGKEKYRALGITKKNSEMFTNLPLIVSDQCAHATKVAVSLGTTATLPSGIIRSSEALFSRSWRMPSMI